MFKTTNILLILFKTGVVRCTKVAGQYIISSLVQHTHTRRK